MPKWPIMRRKMDCSSTWTVERLMLIDLEYDLLDKVIKCSLLLSPTEDDVYSQLYLCHNVWQQNQQTKLTKQSFQLVITKNILNSCSLVFFPPRNCFEFVSFKSAHGTTFVATSLRPWRQLRAIYIPMNQAGGLEEKGMQIDIWLGTIRCPHQEDFRQSGRPVLLLHKLLFNKEGKLRAHTER